MPNMFCLVPDLEKCFTCNNVICAVLGTDDITSKLNKKEWQDLLPVLVKSTIV